MNVSAVNALISALDRVFDETADLKVRRVSTVNYAPGDFGGYKRMVRINIGSPGLDRIVYYFPGETVDRLAMRMYFGLRISDPELIDSAVLELFYRVTNRALESDPSLRINASPVVTEPKPMGDEERLHGLAVHFDSAAGPFSMCALAPA